MASYRLDTDEYGEVVFVEEENGTFKTMAELPFWEQAPSSDDPPGGPYRQQLTPGC